jgi:hypothetical protein
VVLEFKLAMSVPPAFGRYCDDLVNGNYRDKERLWKRVLDAGPQLAAQFRAHSATGKSPL